jgi:hypothetical protein
MSLRSRAARKVRTLAAERGFEIVKVPRDSGTGVGSTKKAAAAGTSGGTKSAPAKRPAKRSPAAVEPVPVLTATSEPGSRKASMFFDAHPRFYETSQTSPYHGRLNLRYEAIFAENRDILNGARVLDIASHDGRWSLAALECGAKSVVGIEARADLVEKSAENLAFYGYAPERYEFIAGDILEVLAEQKLEVDVVLCLGFLYHTLRYNELLHRIKSMRPSHVIHDTEAEGMAKGGRPAVILRKESTLREGNAFPDEYSYGDSVLIGRPNRKAVELMMSAYDFELERLSDWGGLIRDNPQLHGVGDYAKQSRMTMLFRAKE